MSPEDPVLRLARATVFATVCVVVSAGGHAFAGGGAVAPAVMILGGLVSFVLAYVLSGRERGPETVLLATAGTQILLHEVFAQTSPASVAAAPGHGHLGVGMALIHAVVALLTGWWLHRGESAVWAMLRLWGAVPFRLLPLLVAVPVEGPRRVWRAVPADEAGPRCSREFAAAVRRRGPPVPARAG